MAGKEREGFDLVLLSQELDAGERNWKNDENEGA